MKDILCVVKFLYYEAQTTKKKKILKCSDCPIRDTCKGKDGNNHGTE